jgi:hypothetical protein
MHTTHPPETVGSVTQGRVGGIPSQLSERVSGVHREGGCCDTRPLCHTTHAPRRVGGDTAHPPLYHTTHLVTSERGVCVTPSRTHMHGTHHITGEGVHTCY